MRRMLVTIFLATLSLNANALNILLTGIHPERDPVAYLESLGHTVTTTATVPLYTWGSNFDYSAYDLVVFAYGGGNPADIGHLVAAVEAGDVGVVFMRGEFANATAEALGILGDGGGLLWQYAYNNLNVVDNSHPITEGIALGIYDLGYRYMSYITAPGADTTVLATGLDGAALVVHNRLRVAANPSYAHLDGLPDETAFGLELTERTLQWAAGASPEPEVIPVDIDIQPWDAANKVYPLSNKQITVAIHSTRVAAGDAVDFDATTVDPATLKFGIEDASNAQASNVAVTPWVLDLDGDGDNDVVYVFNTQDTDIVCGDTEASLSGETYTGQLFAGTDAILTGCTINSSVVIDIRPSSSVNTVFPTSTKKISVAVLSTSVANGDAVDFDATRVDPATLQFGIGQATHVGTPRVRDVDGDTDKDVIFAFNTQDTGIVCGDIEASLSGETYAGELFAGTDALRTADCKIVTRVAIDIRPSGSVNTVFPTSTKTINVAVLSTSVADGDAVDFDATQVDPVTLTFGSGQAPNLGTPRVRDVDGDADNDVIFAFTTQGTGIACGDTAASLSGKTYAGDLFTGTDAVVTADCVDSSGGL